MAIQQSLFGKINGKIGGVVFSTSGGIQITREYNPNVANPNTEAQVNQRARMKLMSQLSATLAPVITMQKMGLVSARNQFTKRNFGLSYVSNGEAQVSYENLQLTQGNAALPRIIYDTSGDNPKLRLEQAADASVSRVVYIVYRKTAEGKLQLVLSKVQTFASTTGDFPFSLPEGWTDDNYVFYAYGMKDMNAKATAEYGNLNVTTANDLATLVATRKISMTDYQFTQTRGATSNGGQPIEPTPPGYARVYVTANGPGSVSGAGMFETGQTVTVVATPNEFAEFDGWFLNGSNQRISMSASYSFTLNETTDLVAKFKNQEI